MKIKTKFIIYIIIIHLIMIGFAIKIYLDSLKSQTVKSTILQLSLEEPFFFIAEIIIIISIIYSIKLYKSLISPIDLIASGTETIKDKEFNIKFVKVGHKEMDQLIKTYNEMIDKLHDEKVNQQEMNFFLERLVDASPSGIIILDKNEKIYSVNPVIEVLFNDNSENIIGKALHEIDNKLSKELALLQKGEDKVINFNNLEIYKCSNGYFIDKGFNHQFIIIEDLSKEILKTEKKAYEKIIRMMSHEINNSIGAVNSILASFSHYSDQLNIDDRSDYNNALEVSINRNKNLTSFMNNFANIVRIPKPTKINTDLNTLLYSVVTLMKANFSKIDNDKKSSLSEINWELDLYNLDNEEFRVNIDSVLFEQVLINVLKNAGEAILENSSDGPISKTGSIMIKTVINEKNSKELIISNNGKPISSESEQKLFSPFYSTKQNGQGIGLTLIREILINHGFLFSLKTDVDDGFTKFRIRF